MNPYLYPKMPYDPLKDFMPITMVNSAPLLLVVHPSIAAKSVMELIAYAKAHPGQLNYGSGGLGSTPYLAAELFKSLSGIDVVHVPYKGGAPALSDLVGGQLSFMIENMPGTMPYARAGSLRALAITSPQRSQLAPELPTMAEAGVPGYEMSGWNGIFAVKGTPPEIVSETAFRSGQDTAHPGGATGTGRARCGAGRRHARRIRRIPQGRDGALGQDHPRKRHPVRPVNDGQRTRFTREFAALAVPSEVLGDR